MSRAMHPLLGLVLLLAFLAAYAVLAVTLAGLWFPEGDGWSLLYFALAGFLWVPPAALLVRAIRRS